MHALLSIFFGKIHVVFYVYNVTFRSIFFFFFVLYLSEKRCFRENATGRYSVRGYVILVQTREVFFFKIATTRYFYTRVNSIHVIGNMAI